MADENLSGFCLLSLPDPQIQPLSLLIATDKNRAEVTNVNLEDIFPTSEEGLPVPSKDFAVFTGIDKSLVVETAVEGNANLVQHLLGWLKLNGSLKLDKNRTVRIHLQNAVKKNINEFKLDGYICHGTPSHRSPAFLDLLNANRLFVITDIIKCKDYSFEYLDKKELETSVNATAPLQGDATIKVSTARSSNDKMVYSADDAITIAVKAYRILFVKDKTTGVNYYRIRKEDKIPTIKLVGKAGENFDGDMLDPTSIPFIGPANISM
jgi:hypothetical protein